MSALDNPAAFPRSAEWRSEQQNGMTLRDWFAGQVLAGAFSTLSAMPQELDDEAREQLSALSTITYQMADLMLSARATLLAEREEG